MSEKRLLDAEHVARAIFSPAMLDSNGNVSLAAFTLRHNEGYFSVARMAVEGWLDDLKRIPETPLRRLGGYCKMEVGEIRRLGFVYDEEYKIGFDVEDKATTTNMSHAGIIIIKFTKCLTPCEVSNENVYKIRNKKRDMVMRKKFNITGSCNPERHYLVTFDFSKKRKDTEPRWIENMGKRIFEVTI